MNPAHDAELVAIVCERCRRLQRNDLGYSGRVALCRCRHAYARYAPVPALGRHLERSERPGARGRKKRKR